MQFITKTRLFFKKYYYNNLLLIVHIKPELTIDDAFIDSHVKGYKLTLEREVLNYFAYDGLTIDFYEDGKKVHTHEESFNK